jgi:3'(2'), 5'-bisphosphate nucleotidase
VTWQSELVVALEACEKARRLLDEAYARFEAITDAKADIKLDSDVAAQEIILQHLNRVFPYDSFLAEEDTPTLAEIKKQKRDAGRLWIIDPVDGTRGFARKNGEFSVMVGLLAGPDVVVGVVMEPATKRLTYATRDGGCWRRDGDQSPIRCQVTTISELRQSTVVVSHLKPGSTTERQVKNLGTAKIKETYSAGVKLAIVARGEAEMYFNYYANFHDWDVCAGQILVEEAGGQVTVLNGERVAYGGTGPVRDGLLASNGAIHAATLKGLGNSEKVSGTF